MDREGIHAQYGMGYLMPLRKMIDIAIENRWLVHDPEVQLLDIPMKLLEKYLGTGENGKISPVPKYSTIRSNIKKIPKICGIDKSISLHHMEEFAGVAI